MNIADDIERLRILNPELVDQIIAEINQSEEQDRRALMLRRGEIYKDGGKEFLIEELKREFGQDALDEMRLAPLNLLKKIVNKRSNLYKQAPERKPIIESKSDQRLIDFYEKSLHLDEHMDKAHRYFTLYSNTALYCYPVGDEITLKIVPPYQYSVKPNKVEPTIPDVYVFNRFVEEGEIVKQQDPKPEGTPSGFRRDRGFQVAEENLVESNELESGRQRNYIFWTTDQHFTTNENGELLFIDRAQDLNEQIVNPIGMLPVVNLAKDRDGEFWASQFQDTVDLSLAIMKSWSDLLTIAKHQGFSILTVVSEEEPTKLTIGINRAVWLKQRQDGPTPSISYVQAASPLSEYKDLIMELLGLMLSTADLNPKEISGSNGAKNFSSGFQALIETADTLEARKRDMAPMRNAEAQLWERIKRWHNYMFDFDLLNQDARSFGKFSDEFKVAVEFANVKPLESIDDRIGQAERMLGLGLATPKDALKRIHPDLTDEEADAKLQEIAAMRDRLSIEAMRALDGEES